MLASTLISEIKFKVVSPKDYDDFEVSSLVSDTRKVEENSIFVAIKGYTVDGHEFIPEAIRKGAKAIVVQEEIDDIQGVTIVRVNNTNRALAILADKFYGSPSSSMKVIGVTGTNGKTTVTHMIEAIFRDQKDRTGLIGTMYRRIGEKTYPTANTTPDILTLQKTFAEMKKENVKAAAIEVSSIALIQGRVWGIDVDTAVFTNFTQDHLDYHKTMAEYAHAKSLLFAQLGNTYGNDKTAVINIDDEMGKNFAQDTSTQVLTYGIENDAMIKASNVNIHSQGTDFDLKVFEDEYHLHVKTVGMFNVYNLLAAFGAAYANGVSVHAIIESLEKFPGVKGRLQLISSDCGISAIVDYSHTPDGLLNALETINEFASGDVYCVVGCGGDRDATKRPKMAQIAVEYSNHPIFTSDNPRTEDPEKILDQMLSGVPEKNVPVYLDRREAIQAAVNAANPGDIILIAGKGHEDYQIIGHTKHHFDDSEEATKALDSREGR